MIEENSSDSGSRSFRYIFGDNGELIPVGRGLDANSLPEDLILSLKPKGSKYSDKGWLISVRVNGGIAPACSNIFTQYRIDEIQAGRLDPVPSRERAPGLWEKTVFGQAGDQGFRESAGDFEQFTDFMLQHEWKPEQLGVFGQWIIKSGVDQRLIRPIMDSFLRD